MHCIFRSNREVFAAAPMKIDGAAEEEGTPKGSWTIVDGQLVAKGKESDVNAEGTESGETAGILSDTSHLMERDSWSHKDRSRSESDQEIKIGETKIKIKKSNGCGS